MCPHALWEQSGTAGPGSGVGDTYQGMYTRRSGAGEGYICIIGGPSKPYVAPARFAIKEMSEAGKTTEQYLFPARNKNAFESF